MKDVLAIVLDGVVQLEYFRDKPLPPSQEVSLEKMDEKMSKGVHVGDDWVENPEMGQKVQFVAANLANSIKAGNENMAGAMCSWLATRQPDLKQVKIQTEDGGMSIDLDFENTYTKQQPVNFVRH